MIKVFKYAGVAVTGGAPGDTVSWKGISWTVTDQGHLIGEADETDQAVLDLIAAGAIAVQEG